MNNLPEIRDIHIPDGVSFFPLAYGWWIIFASLLFGITLFYFIKWSLKKSKKLFALKELKKIDTNSAIKSTKEMSELLRRICNIKYRQASTLYGQEWIDFLLEHTTSKLSKKEQDLLVFAPFISETSNKYSSQNAEKVKTFCKQWIGENL